MAPVNLLTNAVMTSLVAVLTTGATSRAELLIDGDTLGELAAAGLTVHPSVTTAAGRDGQGIDFSDGGIEIPMADHLAAATGTVELWCRTPDDWPAQEDRTLFHVGEEAHVHVTIFFRNGGLIAVYKGGEEYYASIRHAASRSWEPASWHHVQFTWESDETTVTFFLRVDDELVGMAEGRLIENWPARFFAGIRGARAPWRGLIENVRIAAEPLPLPELQPGSRTIDVYADRPIGECYNFWSISNFTSQHMFADPEQRNSIRRGRPFTRYVNCVRLIGGRTDGRNQYFKGVGPDGKIRCDFTGLIAQLRGMLAWGYTPRIVLDNVPTAMSQPAEMHTYGNTYPPKDFEVWHQYVEAVVRAMVDEFGLDVVSKWRFRVGTEPDLYPGHWAGSKEEYLKHYDYTVDAVTRVIPEADIGPGNILNPGMEDATTASGRPRWGLEIVDHAATGRNYCTGGTGTRLCFLSCSWYGRVGRSMDSFEVAVRRMRERLDRYPQFRDVPVEVAEFAILQDEYGRRLMGGDVTEWGASWYAAIAERVYALNVAQVHEWSQTSAGIRHPRAHVIGMLEQMAGGERLATEVTGTSPARCGAIGVRKGDAIYILLYNHRALRRPKAAEHVSLTVHDRQMKPDNRWRLSEWTVDESHGVFAREFYKDCEEAGIEPLPNAPVFGGSISRRLGGAGAQLLRANIEKYQKLAALPQTKVDELPTVGGGQVTFEIEMPGHSVRLLKLSPGAQASLPASVSPSRLAFACATHLVASPRRGP